MVAHLAFTRGFGCAAPWRYHTAMSELPMPAMRHGVDLVEIDRIGRMLEDHGERFISRCFTEAEAAYAEQGRSRRIERYAVRFACKEACLKALGTGWRDGIRWRDMETTRSADGEPGLRLSGRCLELARAWRITQWAVSLSHTRTHAIASVIGWGPAAASAAGRLTVKCSAAPPP